MAEPSRLQRLFSECGQAPWLDALSRDDIQDGTLAALIARGVRGVTSNPSIFEKAISGSVKYDTDIEVLASDGASVDDAYWSLVVDDIQHAADLFKGLYSEAAGSDGYVSVEIDPRLADETESSIDAGKALFLRVNRPNVMIKVPATAAGVPVIEELLANGVNVNVTLIFSLDRYDEVLGAWKRGLDPRPRCRSGRAAQRRLVLRQPRRYRGRQASGCHRLSGGAGAAGQGGRRAGPGRLRELPPLRR